MRIPGASLFTLALISSAALAQAPAQAPGGATTIRTETRLVLVDAVATDKKGGYVTDLEIKDFKVWEDGKEQTLKSFSMGSDPAAPAQSRRRYMVLFFDNSSMDIQDQQRARLEAAKFVDANAGPDHLMAVVNFSGALQIAQNFTQDADRLRQVVQGAKFSATTTQAGAETGSLQIAQFGRSSMLMSLARLAKNLGDVPGRKTLILFTSGFPMNTELRSEESAAINACNRSNVAIYPVDVRGLTTPLFSPRRGAVLDGRTGNALGLAFAGTPVLRIAGFLAAPPQRGGTGGGPPGGGGAPGGVGAPGGGAGRGGSSPGGGGGVNPGGGAGGRGPSGSPGPIVNPGGGRSGTGNTGVGNPGNTNPGNTGGRGGNVLNPNMGNFPGGRAPGVLIPTIPESAATNQQVMYELAAGTGGFVIANTNDLLGGLEKIGKEQDHYYILGYTPPDSPEGSCHQIRVKVNRAANVRARSGYCNVKGADVLAGTPIEKRLESRAAGSDNGIAAKMQAPFFYTGPDTARVNVAIDIPSADVKFEKVKGKFHAEINVLGIIARPNAEVAARFSDAVKLDFDNKKDVEKFQEKPYRYDNQFDVASGKYTFKLVFNSGGESFGKLETPLDIEPYDGKHFAMSSLVLSPEVHPTSEDATLDTTLLEGHSPLVAGNRRFTPAGSNRFLAGQNPGIYLEIYEPLLQDSDPELAIVLRVLDRNTGAPKVDSGFVSVTKFVQKGSPTVPVGLKLPLASVTPGAYRLEIRAVDSKNREAVRTADFDVN